MARFFKLDMTLSLKNLLPAIAFFGGFLWDALTIGHQINPSDLWFLAAYLLAAGLILYWMGHKSHAHGLMAEAQRLEASNRPEWQKKAPTFILQFLFGSLFSALFILYFKSANHFLALFWSLGLGFLLVDGQQMGKPAQILAAIITFAVLGKIADTILLLLTRPLLVWQDTVRESL